MFAEPTRRLPFSPRFSYDARYGASLATVLLGSYLLLNVNYGPLASNLGGFGGYSPALMLLLVGQLVFAIAATAVGFLIHPGTTGRRVLAAAIVVAGIAIWVVVFVGRITGAVRMPPEGNIFLSPAFIVTLVAAAGWLIVRERPALSYLLLIVTIAGGVVPWAMVLNGADVGMNQLVLVPLAALTGVGIAWGARAIHAGMFRPAEQLPPPAG